MKNIILAIGVLIFSCEVYDINKNQEVKVLSDAINHEDSIDVIDNWFYNENGNIKPPCSLSPYYEECMKCRIQSLNLDIKL